MRRTEADAALYFQAHYILWVVGELEPEVEEELDALNPAGVDWKEVMERDCPWSRADLQTRYSRLCETLSDEEALDAFLQEVGFAKT